MFKGIKFTFKKQFADLTKNVTTIWSKYVCDPNYKNLLIPTLLSTDPIMKYLGEERRPEELIYHLFVCFLFLSLCGAWTGHNQISGWVLWRSKGSLGVALSTGFKEITEIWLKQDTPVNWPTPQVGSPLMQECCTNAYKSACRALKNIAPSKKSWYALSRGREKQKKVKIVTVIPHSLSSPDAEVAPFPSCSPQISALCNCSQPRQREEGRGEISRRCVLVPGPGHGPARGQSPDSASPKLHLIPVDM